MIVFDNGTMANTPQPPKLVSEDAGFLRQSGFSADTINQREAAVSKSRLTNQCLMLEKLMK
jgi:hypothetical protein